MQYTFFKREHILFSSDQPVEAIIIDTFPGWRSNHFPVSHMKSSANSLFSFISPQISASMQMIAFSCWEGILSFWDFDIWPAIDERDWTASEMTSALMTSTCFKDALKAAQNGHRVFTINHQAKPKWEDICRSVLFEKRMLHLWLSSWRACSHVIIPSPITPLHIFSAPHRFQSGWGGSCFMFLVGRVVFVADSGSFCLTQVVRN